MTPNSLLARLDAIGASLATRSGTLALIGLGSVGLERDRLDAYSDLDFFVIVEPGRKRAFIDDLGWLQAAGPIAYAFANSRDGHKVLYSDGVFCEFAVFEPDELSTIPFAPGQVVWRRNGVAQTIGQPANPPAQPAPRSREWLLGEALTNLYVGLGRERRGERLSALRFIQGYAVDRLVELAAMLAPGPTQAGDPFTPERRFERRYPHLTAPLPTWLQGYERNRESALAILDFLETHMPVNAAMAAAIRDLCAQP